MNATQAVLGLWGFFVHGVPVHVDEIDSLLLIGAVTREMANFSTVETGITGGTRLVGVHGSSLEVLVSSSASSLVASSTPVRIGPAEVHGYWLVVHAGWGVRRVILWVLLGIIRVVSPVEEWVSLLVGLWSQGVSGGSSFLLVVPGLQYLAQDASVSVGIYGTSFVVFISIQTICG